MMTKDGNETAMTETVIQRDEVCVLTKQVAIVTGAGRGIGEAVAHRLARMGASVVLTARDRARLSALQAAIEKQGGRAMQIPVELTDEKAVAAFGERVAKEYGRCDILVNNAGVGAAGKPLVELTPEEWGRVLDTNLRAPYLMIRAFAPLMIAARSGHIINISSLAGKNPLPNGAAYAASKWGLNGLTYSVAEELRQYGVRVSVIAPGSVDTSFGSGQAPGQGKDRSKMVQPADVAHVVATIVTQAPNSFVSEVLLRPTMKP
jgi:3-oxoacyl-[acyl-carrier protein] reductase